MSARRSLAVARGVRELLALCECFAGGAGLRLWRRLSETARHRPRRLSVAASHRVRHHAPHLAPHARAYESRVQTRGSPPESAGGGTSPPAPARLNTLPDLGAFCEACDGGGGLNAYLSLSHS